MKSKKRSINKLTTDKSRDNFLGKPYNIYVFIFFLRNQRLLTSHKSYANITIMYSNLNMQPTFVYTCMYINKSTNFGPFELCPERLMEMIGWTETIAGLLAQSGGDGPSAPPPFL